MSYVRIRSTLAASFVLAMLMGLTGCGGDRREHIRPHQDRYPDRYERQDDHRHEERHESDRHEDRDERSDRGRGDHGDAQ